MAIKVNGWNKYSFSKIKMPRLGETWNLVTRSGQRQCEAVPDLRRLLGFGDLGMHADLLMCTSVVWHLRGVHTASEDCGFSSRPHRDKCPRLWATVENCHCETDPVVIAKQECLSKPRWSFNLEGFLRWRKVSHSFLLV